MPSVFCPGCGRQLNITSAEQAAGITLECAQCGTCFHIAGTAPPPPEERAAATPTSEEITADEGEMDEADEPTPATTGMAPATKIVLTGLAVVAGLIVAVGGIALAVANNRPNAAQPQAAPGKSPTPVTSASRDEPAGYQIALGGCACVGFIALVVGAVIAISGATKACPSCRRWWATTIAGQTLLEQKKCYGLVTRTSHSSSYGSWSGTGSRSGRYYGGSSSRYGTRSWQVRVPVVRTTYLVHYGCKYCGYSWDRTKVQEVEDFDIERP
jgi:hypothetical protein